MKKILRFLILPLFVCFFACNEVGGNKEKATPKITDITATTKSTEAMASFQEGLAALDLNDVKKARAAFSKAIEQDPTMGIAYLYRANTSTSAKEFADDINAGKSKLDSASNWEKLYADYQSTNLSGDRNKGLEILQKIATAYPDVARAQNDLGNAAAGNNQFDKARTLYQKAIQLNPTWVGGYAALAGSYMFNEPKDLKKAEENALKVVELAPKSSGAQITMGDCYRAQNDFAKAKTAYAKAVELNPTAPEAYYKEGHANIYLGNYDEARKNYADAGNNDVTKSGSVLNTAYSYLYQNNTASAIKELMDAATKTDSLEVNKNKSANEKNGYLSTCATIAIHNGDAAALKKLVPMILPLSEQLTNDLGTPEAKIFIQADKLNWETLMAYKEGKYDEAMAKAEAMKVAYDPIKDDRKLEGYHYNMGLISMKQKKYAEAITHFEKADPNNIYNKYWLAKANEAAGNKEKANLLYKEIAAYNFNDVGNALVRGEVKKKLNTP
jgi:tetratricopeptide (TPR) repeat protein